MTWLILVYGILVAGGGLLGYLKARSQASLRSGGLSGLALFAIWCLSGPQPRVAFLLAACLAVVLAVVFGLRYRKTGKFMPVGLLGLLSLLAGGAFGYSLSLMR